MVGFFLPIKRWNLALAILFVLVGLYGLFQIFQSRRRHESDGQAMQRQTRGLAFIALASVGFILGHCAIRFIS